MREKKKNETQTWKIKTTEIYFSQFWKSEVQNLFPSPNSRCLYPSGGSKITHFLLLPVSSEWQTSLAVAIPIQSLPLSYITLPSSLCVVGHITVPLSLRTSHVITFRGHHYNLELSPHLNILNHIYKDLSSKYGNITGTRD